MGEQPTYSSGRALGQQSIFAIQDGGIAECHACLFNSAPPHMETHLVGSRMMANGLHLLLLTHSVQLTVDGAFESPTKPGGGGCLNAVSPKFNCSSAFCSEKAGNSAAPPEICTQCVEVGQKGLR